MDILDEFSKYLEQQVFETRGDKAAFKKGLVAFDPRKSRYTPAAAMKNRPVREPSSGHSSPRYISFSQTALKGSGAAQGIEATSDFTPHSIHPKGFIQPRQVTMASDLSKDSPTQKAIKDAAKAADADKRAKAAASKTHRVKGASLDAQIAGAAKMMGKLKGLNKVGDKVRTDTVVTFKK